VEDDLLSGNCVEDWGLCSASWGKVNQIAMGQFYSALELVTATVSLCGFRDLMLSVE